MWNCDLQSAFWSCRVSFQYDSSINNWIYHIQNTFSRRESKIYHEIENWSRICDCHDYYLIRDDIVCRWNYDHEHDHEYNRWCRCFEDTCYSFCWLIRSWRYWYKESWSNLRTFMMSHVIRSIKSNDLCMLKLKIFAYDSNRDNQSSILFERHSDQYIIFENI
jgi:hypothetical protein